MKYKIKTKSITYDTPVSRLRLAAQQACFEISEETPANEIQVIEVDDTGQQTIHSLDKLLTNFPDIDWLLEIRKRLIKKQKEAETKVNETESQLLELERTIGQLEKKLKNK